MKTGMVIAVSFGLTFGLMIAGLLYWLYAGIGGAI